MAVGVHSSFSFPPSGKVILFSGATRKLIRIHSGPSPGINYGSSIASAGDVNKDGRDDIIVGDYTAGPGGLFWAGSAQVFCGATGALIWQFDGAEVLDMLGWSVSGAGDLDGDDTPDLIIGAMENQYPYDGPGYASVFSGATGSLIETFQGANQMDMFGHSVSGAGDLDDDGLHEFLVGSPFADLITTNEGSALVFSLDPFLTPDAPILSATPGSSVQLELDFPSGEAGFGYAILASKSGTGPTTQGGLDIPLTPDSLFLRMLGGRVPAPLQAGIGLLDGSGDAAATVNGDPALSPLIGRTLYLAAVSYDSATMTGRLSSIARYLTIVP